MPSPLLSANTFNRSAIMVRAWAKARNEAARSGAAGLRACFAAALRLVWAEARSARSYAIWAAEQDAAAEAAKTLDARTREIRALDLARASAIGIENSHRYFAEVRAIDARLAQLGV